MQIFGYCSQFKARFTKKMLIFKGNAKPRVESFGIVNDYSQDIEFCFLETSSFFNLKTYQGIVKKNSIREIKISFNEKIPGNYWKQLHCVITGHWLLKLDCYASVGDVLKRPIPIDVYTRKFYEKENLDLQNISGRILDFVNLK